jgi:hypothetical protein
VIKCDVLIICADVFWLDRLKWGLAEDPLRESGETIDSLGGRQGERRRATGQGQGHRQASQEVRGSQFKGHGGSWVRIDKPWVRI